MFKFDIFDQTKKFNFIKSVYNKNNEENTLLQIGKKVKKLGEGGCANVILYKCKDQNVNCNKLFVVKQVYYNPKIYEYETFKLKATRSVIKEYIITKMLMHDNIIKIEGIDLKNLALLYKYDNSKDLLYYFTEEEFKAKKYFKYYIQIIDAVKYMHSIGIAHMDLKLENILFNRIENKIKIIDFGHSCFFKKGTEIIYNKGIKGTDYYIPPEVWTGAYMSDKVDVWCCGIILFNFIYNRMPWEKADEYEDKIYSMFKIKRCKDELCDKIFEHPSLYGFNYEDSYIILDLFLMMFDLSYYNRCNINKIYKKLLKITLE